MRFEGSKRVKALLRHAATARERELRILLEKLEKHFERWRRGEIATLDMADAVDRFTRGRERRDLDQRYESSQILHVNVARAIATGLLKPEEVPGDLLVAVEGVMNHMKKGLADGTICIEAEED